MLILSHRGYWKDDKEKNQKIAFQRSFDMGFGTETDVRDSMGKIVIAHDMPMGGEITLENLLDIMAGRNLPLALNIKADGLCEIVRDILGKYGHHNYFCFDMSIPDMIIYMRKSVKFFTGLSDILSKPVLLEEADGVWLDSFNSDWYQHHLIDEIINENKTVCVVSSDLHKRSNKEQWGIIKKSHNINSDKLILCTDYPEEARRYFNEKN